MIETIFKEGDKVVEIVGDRIMAFVTVLRVTKYARRAKVVLANGTVYNGEGRLWYHKTFVADEQYIRHEVPADRHNIRIQQVISRIRAVTLTEEMLRKLPEADLIALHAIFCKLS